MAAGCNHLQWKTYQWWDLLLAMRSWHHNRHKCIKIVDFGLSNRFETNQLLKTACALPQKNVTTVYNHVSCQLWGTWSHLIPRSPGGSPCYAPPEMVSGQSYVPQMCDLWSCGVKLGCNDADDEEKTWKGGKAKDQMPRTLRERERPCCRDTSCWLRILFAMVCGCRSRIAKRCFVSLSTERFYIYIYIYIYMHLQYIYVCLFIYIWYAYPYTSDTYGLTHADTCMCICSTACIQYTYPIHG